MYIGSSILLIAVGAILRWAVSWHVSGFNVQLAGLIVFLVGILGLVITLVLWYTRRDSSRDSRGTRRTDSVVPQDYRPDDSGRRP
jgi:uncharacterized membrane protein YedE/YeeE